MNDEVRFLIPTIRTNMERMSHLVLFKVYDNL